PTSVRTAATIGSMFASSLRGREDRGQRTEDRKLPNPDDHHSRRRPSVFSPLSSVLWPLTSCGLASPESRHGLDRTGILAVSFCTEAGRTLSSKSPPHLPASESLIPLLL